MASPIDAAPHRSWKTASQALRLPPASVPPGTGRFTALSNAAARVQQLDATRLDMELLMILQFQLRKVIESFGQDALSTWKPEMDALLPCLLYCFTVLTNLPTPGMMLQNLRFTDETSSERISKFAGQRAAGRTATDVTYGKPLPSQQQRIALGLMTVGLQYVWGRFNAAATSRGWADMTDPQLHSKSQQLRARAVVLLRRLQALLVVASCLHHLHFLATGSYRGIAERLLSMRLVQARPEGMQRLHMFEYMNRQLIWTGIADFGLFFMTVVDIAALWRKIRGVVRGRLGKTSAKQMAANRLIAADGRCPLCARKVGTPYALKHCGHSYCYYCLAMVCPALVVSADKVPAEHRRNQSFRCVVCNHIATAAERSSTAVAA